MSNDKRRRINIPPQFIETLPYIWWALMRIRGKMTNEIEWVSIPSRLSEGMVQPAFETFTEETQKRINALSELHKKSRSCVVVTALQEYQNGPSKPDKPRGLKDNQGVNQNGR